MDFISNRQPQIEEMLQVIGLSSLEELFDAIPPHLKLDPPKEDDGLSEMEGLQMMESLAAKNRFPDYDHYLGAGAYDHHIPALVPYITSKGEFLTSYTPYQSEASQGYLQIIFEFQTAIAHLTGLDIANASVYDGASACAEGLLMAMRHFRGKRKKALIAASLNPNWRAVVDLYFRTRSEELMTIPFQTDGSCDLNLFEDLLDDQCAAVLLPYPNFFGQIEDYAPLIEKIHEKGALAILAANPLAFALYKSAGELGADICVGDGQPFGLPLNFGGPYVGFIACQKPLMRQMPGRLVGETVDREGKRGYVLTLQAREQHIRREKATSNICTNQALAALACLVTLLWYGKEGLPKLAMTNFQRASYLKSHLEKLPHFTPLSDAPFLNEFVMRTERPLNAFYDAKILPGLELSPYFLQFKDHLLICVTELKSQAMLDRYLEVAAS